MLSLTLLPKEIVYYMIQYLKGIHILQLMLVNHHFYQLFKKHELWKSCCLWEFPFFFYHGACERTLGRILNCDSCRIKADNPFHPLLTHGWRLAFIRIYFGSWSGPLHVVNSLVRREMSAFYALATFDFKSQCFLLCYNEKIISRYRLGEMILLTHHPELVDERLPEMGPKHRFRRIPYNLLLQDPRSLHTETLFNQPLLSDGRPAFLEGEEIEVQWRASRTGQFAFWKGVIAASYMIPELLNPNPSSIHAPNVQFHPLVEEGMIILFPHYPPDSPWVSLVASLIGLENVAEGSRGYVGGVKRIDCPVHQIIWQEWFDESTFLVRDL